MSERNGGNAGQMLRDFVDSLEELEKERLDVKGRTDEVWARVKARGFSKKVLKKMLKEREEGQAIRREFDQLCEIYRKALGMAPDQPLSDEARKRFDPPPPERPKGEEPPKPGRQEELPQTAAVPIDDNAVREEGRQACRDGKRVLDNPYVAGDPRRALWDEGWCMEAGSDGMDIPAAYKPAPKPPKKPPSGDSADGDAASAAAGAGAPQHDDEAEGADEE